MRHKIIKAWKANVIGSFFKDIVLYQISQKNKDDVLLRQINELLQKPDELKELEAAITNYLRIPSNCVQSFYNEMKKGLQANEYKGS
jgi:hypothetical protein